MNKLSFISEKIYSIMGTNITSQSCILESPDLVRSLRETRPIADIAISQTFWFSSSDNLCRVELDEIRYGSHA